MYVPKAKREFGYYVLPILVGDEIVGRAEPVFDRKTGTLDVLGAWGDTSRLGEALPGLEAFLRQYAPRMKSLLVPALVAATCVSAAAATTLPGFRSPSGNIWCLVIPGPPRDAPLHARARRLCEDAAGTVPRPDRRRRRLARLRAARGAQGHGLVLGRRAVQPRDPASEPQHARVRQDVAAPFFRCTSAVTGVNCSTPSGHGFFISRETWRTW